MSNEYTILCSLQKYNGYVFFPRIYVKSMFVHDCTFVETVCAIVLIVIAVIFKCL